MKRIHLIILCVSLLCVSAVLFGCKKTAPTVITSEETSLSEITSDSSHYQLSERTESVSEEEYFPFEASTEKSHELIRDIIMFHGYYRGEKDDKVDELFEELKAENSREAKLWREIIDYWDYANNEMPVNIGKLPDDLPNDDSLCIMILGFELYDDGSMQPELIGRLNVALDCANQYPNAYVVCTGGGTAINNKAVTEADLMGKWLVEHGLDESRLIIENKSQTTAENAIFSYGILREKYPNVDSVALISSSYHIPWGALLLEAAFMKTASDGQSEEMHVIANAAYEFVNQKYADVPRFETGGLLQLIGEESLAMRYYMNTQTAP
jgi:hypothetical protein